MTDDMTPDDPTTTPTGRAAPLSVGPFDQRPAGELRAYLAEITAAGFCVPDWRARRAAWLRACLLRAGVELWSWDDHVLEAVASWEPEVVHAIGAWVLRAAGRRGHPGPGGGHDPGAPA